MKVMASFTALMVTVALLFIFSLVVKGIDLCVFLDLRWR
jgi:hypothetical protein